MEVEEYAAIQHKRWDERRFYAYTLTNSLTNLVFYVGKGTDYRVNEHENQARRGVQSPKCNLIRQIQSSGGRVIKTIVKNELTSQEAIDLENALIEQYGIENLTNLTPSTNIPVSVSRSSYVIPAQVSIVSSFRDEVDAQIRICMERDGIEVTRSSCYNYIQDMLYQAIRERIESNL